MRVTSSREIPPPPPRMPVTFHLDLDEDEALILAELMGSIGGESNRFRTHLSNMWEQLDDELRRQNVMDPDRAYAAAKELRNRGLYPSSQLNCTVGRYDKGL